MKDTIRLLYEWTAQYSSRELLREAILSEKMEHMPCAVFGLGPAVNTNWIAWQHCVTIMRQRMCDVLFYLHLPPSPSTTAIIPQ